MLIFAALLIIQPIIAQEAPQATAKPSQWLSWYKSLRAPKRTDVLQTKRYLSSKWRCLRHGEGCSRKERNVLRALVIAAGVAIAGSVRTGYRKWTTRGRPQRDPAQPEEAERGINAPDSIWAYAADGNLAGVQRLIGAGTDVNAQDDFGNTPLMVAVEWGHLAIVRYILGLANGAQSAQQAFYKSLTGDPDFETYPNVEIVRALVESGNIYDFSDAVSRSVQDCNENVEETEKIVEYLLSLKRVNPNKGLINNPPAIEAIENGCFELAEKILEHPNTNLELHHAYLLQELELNLTTRIVVPSLRNLLQLEVSTTLINHLYPNDMTLLMKAVEKNNPELVKALLEVETITPAFQNSKGQTARDFLIPKAGLTDLERRSRQAIKAMLKPYVKSSGKR